MIATAREVCNATRRLGDWSRLILHQRVRGYARAVRAVRNTRVFPTETRVVADEVESRSKSTIKASQRKGKPSGKMRQSRPINKSSRRPPKSRDK